MKKKKKISGRQRLVWPVFESIKQASGVLHYTEAELKICKASGSKAFISGGRVDSGILIPDLNDLLHKASEVPKGFTTWKEFGESRRAQITDVELKEKKKQVMQTSEVKRQVGEGVGMMFNEIDRRDRELPPALAGRNAVEISERMLADTKSIKKTLAEKFKEIGE